MRIPGRQLPTDTLGGVSAVLPSGQETCPTTAGLGPWGSHLETSDVVPEPECIAALRRAREQLWRVVRCSHASFAPASTHETPSRAREHPLSLDDPAPPDRSPTLPDHRETCSADVSNPHRLIFSKTSTHVSCRYRCLRTGDACGSRRLHRFGGPDLGSGCSVEHPAYDSSRSLDTDVIFPCRPSGTDPLTTRHPRDSRPPRLERTESAAWTETGFTRAREGHALPRSGPPSIVLGAFIAPFPDPVPAATPVRFGSRRPFARRVGPPRGGSALRARPHLLATVFAA